jgi:hypothetical protein
VLWSASILPQEAFMLASFPKLYKVKLRLLIADTSSSGGSLIRQCGNSQDIGSFIR